jgi:hypothetical protein
MANGEWRMANGEWRMANGEWRMKNPVRAFFEKQAKYPR